MSTNLFVIENGALSALRYCNEIQDQIVRPHSGAIGLMDDNTSPHRANVTNVYLERETIIRMDWPAKPPDMNPIEHAWDILSVRFQPDLCNTGLYRGSIMHLLLNGG